MEAILLLFIVISYIIPLSALFLIYSLPRQLRLGEKVPTRRFVPLYWSLIIYPTLCFFLVAFFCIGYLDKSDVNHDWLRCIHYGKASLVLVPVWILAVISLAGSLIAKKRLLGGSSNFIGLIVLCLISGWYTYDTFFKRHIFDVNIYPLRIYLGFIPLIACLSYALLIYKIWKNREGNLFNWSFVAIWLFLFATSIIAKFYYAYQFYQSLPEYRPPPSSDCFIVTAASQGDPSVVKSSYDFKKQKVVNQQLQRMWAFEDILRERVPRFHKGLRFVYNRAGPVIARRIKHPLVADMVYIVLKPVEWTALAFTKFWK